MQGSLINRLAERSKQKQPTVGDGATILMYSDRHAATIIEVGSKHVVIQEDIAIRTDGHGMSDSQSYDYERCPTAPKDIFTLRKNGRWVRKGESQKGTCLLIGHRDHYYDYSF